MVGWLACRRGTARCELANPNNTVLFRYAVEEKHLLEKSTDSVIYNRHGIRILVVQTGRLGKYSFQVGVMHPACCDRERRCVAYANTMPSALARSKRPC